MSPFPLCLSPPDAVISGSSLTLLHWLLEARDPPQSRTSRAAWGGFSPSLSLPGTLAKSCRVGQVGWAEPVLPAPGLHPGLLCPFRRVAPRRPVDSAFQALGGWGRPQDPLLHYSCRQVPATQTRDPRLQPGLLWGGKDGLPSGFLWGCGSGCGSGPLNTPLLLLMDPGRKPVCLHFS